MKSPAGDGEVKSTLVSVVCEETLGMEIELLPRLPSAAGDAEMSKLWAVLERLSKERKLSSLRTCGTAGSLMCIPAGGRVEMDSWLIGLWLTFSAFSFNCFTSRMVLVRMATV